MFVLEANFGTFIETSCLVISICTKDRIIAVMLLVRKMSWMEQISREDFIVKDKLLQQNLGCESLKISRVNFIGVTISEFRSLSLGDVVCIRPDSSMFRLIAYGDYPLGRLYPSRILHLIFWWSCAASNWKLIQLYNGIGSVCLARIGSSNQIEPVLNSRRFSAAWWLFVAVSELYIFKWDCKFQGDDAGSQWSILFAIGLRNISDNFSTWFDQKLNCQTRTLAAYLEYDGKNL